MLDTIAAGVTVLDYVSHAKSVPGGPRAFVDFVENSANARYANLANTRLYTPIGMHKTAYDTASGGFLSNVDELYRFELGLEADSNLTRAGTTNVFTPLGGGATGNALGWTVDKYKGQLRESVYGTKDGKRAAFVRLPEKKVVIIVLTNSETADLKQIAERIAGRF